MTKTPPLANPRGPFVNPIHMILYKIAPGVAGGWRGSAILGACSLLACTVQAQQVQAANYMAVGASTEKSAVTLDAVASMPDAPSAMLAAQQNTSANTVEKQNTPAQQTPKGTVNPDTGDLKQTKRILGIIPNFRAVSADTKLPSQSVKEKFVTTSQQSFDYSSILFSAILAGVNQADNSDREFHQGAAGYGRYFWHTYADQTDENFWVQAILPAVFRQDSRYYTLGHGNIVRRAAYAFDRTLITRTDAGSETFNVSEVLGAGIASSISTAYYPSDERDWTKTGQRWLQNVIIDGGTYMFQEFWPNINSALFHQKD